MYIKLDLDELNSQVGTPKRFYPLVVFSSGGSLVLQEGQGSGKPSCQKLPGNEFSQIQVGKESRQKMWYFCEAVKQKKMIEDKLLDFMGSNPACQLESDELT